MAYRIELSRRAQQDLDDLYSRVTADDSAAAAAWFERLKAAVYSLDRFPRRGPIAVESRSFGLQIRHLIYGGRGHGYRIIYQIDELHKVVGIVTIRHGAMDEFDPSTESS
jgi:plasmid stabilization system protein ParE